MSRRTRAAEAQGQQPAFCVRVTMLRLSSFRGVTTGPAVFVGSAGSTYGSALVYGSIDNRQ